MAVGCPSVRRITPFTAVILALAATVTASPARAATIGAAPVATGLANPAAFTFAPDGRIFYGERTTGQIRILNPSTGSNTPFFTVPAISADGEQGVLGIALHPAFPSKPFVYVYASRVVAGAQVNQILRLRDADGMGTAMKVIYQAPAGFNHNGGHIAFGPDRKLYAVVGELTDPANAQNLDNTLGKVLRMTAAGRVPADNPFPGSLIWSYGTRNSFGFTFDPQTRSLWETENGPACNDELNRIVKGLNYGWGPSQTCSSPPAAPLNTNRDGPDPQLPVSFYTPTIAPTGAAFCSGCGLGSAVEGTFFYGTYNTSQIRQVSLDPQRRVAAGEVLAYQNSSGVLSVERAPSGTIYFSDSVGIYRLVST